MSGCERRGEGLQWKSERSGDWSGKPGRAAAPLNWNGGPPRLHRKGMGVEALDGDLADPGAVVQPDPSTRIFVEADDVHPVTGVEDIVVGVDVAHILSIGVVDAGLVGGDALEADSAHGVLLEGASHHAIVPNVNTIGELRTIWPRLTLDEKKLFDVVRARTSPR